MEQQRDEYEEIIEDLREKLTSDNEQFKENMQKLQHDLDMSNKKVSDLTVAYEDLKARFEKKEIEFKEREEDQIEAFRTEKRKLDEKIDKLTGENHTYEKDLMSLRQTSEQRGVNLERKEALIADLERELSAQKEASNEELEKMHEKIGEIERTNHERVTNYERENALVNQKNEFCIKRNEELEELLKNSSRVNEEKMNLFKTEKEAETRERVEKLMEEKANVDAKYQKLKTESKEREETLKKGLIELTTAKETDNLKIRNLEEKVKELEEKRTVEMAQLQRDL